MSLLERHREGFFPETFTGCLLLMRSGLDAQERSAILAKTNDSLKQVDVESALTRLWMDYDLREREIKRKVSASSEDSLQQSQTEMSQQQNMQQKNKPWLLDKNQRPEDPNLIW